MYILIYVFKKLCKLRGLLMGFENEEKLDI